jgi:hypothetical protein
MYGRGLEGFLFSGPLLRTPRESRGQPGRPEEQGYATRLERSGAGPKGRGAGRTIKPGDCAQRSMMDRTTRGETYPPEAHALWVGEAFG